MQQEQLNINTAGEEKKEEQRKEKRSTGDKIRDKEKIGQIKIRIYKL
jgi:hypothetical protein